MAYFPEHHLLYGGDCLGVMRSVPLSIRKQYLN
jgi:hypothetical protein